MSCRSSAPGQAASAAATALSGVAGSSDRVPELMHRLRREYANAYPDAPAPSGEEAAQVLERLAMEVRLRRDIREWRKERVDRKVRAACVELRRERHVPSAALLHAFRSLPDALLAESKGNDPKDMVLGRRLRQYQTVLDFDDDALNDLDDDD